MSSETKSMKVRIVHMGDSITFGQYLDSTFRWTTLIEKRLQREYARTGVEIVSINHGVSGETTRMGLERFPRDVQDQYPEVMTLQFGLNDCNCWMTDKGLPRVSAAAFRANLIEMIDRATRFGAQRIVLANNHPTLRFGLMPSGERYEDANERYSAIVKEIAEERTVSFCDIRTAFAGFPSETMESMLLPYPDHLHLSKQGNEVYADAIWPLIRESVASVVDAKSKHKERDHEDCY